MQIILASASPARAALLRQANIPFQAIPSNVDESPLKTPGVPPEHIAVALAQAKAAAVAQTHPGHIVIGADQILVCGGQHFGKPRNLAEARSHLQALRGRFHTLVTAVTVLQAGAAPWSHVAYPRLRMRPFSDMALDHYLEIEGACLLQTVGVYRIEGPGIILFDSIEGEHTAILGLPLLPLLVHLRHIGVLPT